MARMARSEKDWETLAVTANYAARKLAALCHRSVRQLQREFRASLNTTPQEWLNERRMEEARGRLTSGEQVKKVAAELGFKQTPHFCKHFKARNKMTASEFLRAKVRRPDPDVAPG